MSSTKSLDFDRATKLNREIIETGEREIEEKKIDESK
jgi:hypothetical protein